jgi:hypothetical protein
MLKGKELISGIEQYGRWNVQEFVTRSRDITDVFTYLKVERIFEMFSAATFVTKDSVSFEKRTGLPFLTDKTQKETKDDLNEMNDLDLP